MAIKQSLVVNLQGAPGLNHLKSVYVVTPVYYRKKVFTLSVAYY